MTTSSKQLLDSFSEAQRALFLRKIATHPGRFVETLSLLARSPLVPRAIRDRAGAALMATVDCMAEALLAVPPESLGVEEVLALAVAGIGLERAALGMPTFDPDTF